ncbi:MAG: hypothetical protein C4576_10730 [Desulfobacteraceae bacterium]|jgi:hypothetical protein|nr:MAG: hypothetical protein C4576_10730 [Desulfobacteraceae bacterium]
MSDYIHSIPGRLRIRISKIKSKPATAEALQALLGRLHGIVFLSINPLTAKVLIIYSPEIIGSEKILEALRKKGFLEAKTPGGRTNRGSLKSRARQAVGKALFGWAVGRALEGTGLSFLAAFI